MEACKREGIDPACLVKKKPEDFAEKGVSDKIRDMRFKFYDNKRKGNSSNTHYAEMLAVVIKARESIIAKLEAVPHPKPGVFITPVEALTHQTLEPVTGPKPGSKPDLKSDPKARRGSEPPISEETAKFLEQQNDVNREQLGFFLRAHERHDTNLKKNMEFALNCLRKREEIDRM